jgi:putative cardiolipin synthase
VLPGLVMVASLLLVACAQAALDYPRSASWALPRPQETRMGSVIAPHLLAWPARSGFCLLSNGPDALAIRLAMIDAAERTVDLQSFIIADDVVGNLLLDRMLAAAGRGVRVRLLVDDWNLTGQDRHLAGLDTQSGFEVRVYNPAGSPRGCPLTRPLHYLFGPRRVLNRMHNKAFIVDNTLAIVGGRNIAEGYFTASGDYNFGDIDLLAAGPAAVRVSEDFDEFWNDRLAVPIEAFVSRDHTDEYARETRRTLREACDAALASPFAIYLRGSRWSHALRVGRLPLVWAEGEVLDDRPGKGLYPADESAPASMISKLEDLLDEARTEAILISPYLVPGAPGMEFCHRLHRRGVAVRLLTNSLASTDEVAPQGAYEKYRVELLRCGVELYELRPQPHRRGKDRRDHAGSTAGAGLHAKCLIVDRRVVFIGSPNFDSRSVEMDTQNGIVVRSAELAEELAEVFSRRTSPGYAYRVTLREEDGGESLVWSDEVDGVPVHHTSDPLTGPWRRFTAWFLAFLLPEEWL